MSDTLKMLLSPPEELTCEFGGDGGMSGNAAEQTELILCQQQVAVLEAELAQLRLTQSATANQPHLASLQPESDRLQTELAQARSHLEILQQQCDRLTAECDRLRQSESRYRQIFDNAPISMLLINTDGYLTQMNAAAENLFGLSIDQLNQQCCFDNPQLLENGTLPYMLRAFAGEAVIEPPTYYDASKDSPDGEINQGRGHYASVRDAMGKVKEIVEISADFDDFFALQKQLLAEKECAAQERARLLSTIAQIANLLLRSPDYTAVLPDVVRLLGEAVGSDRCAIVTSQTYPVSHCSLIQTASEWYKPGIPSSNECTPELTLMTWQDFLELYECLLQGEVANYLVTSLSRPSRNLFTAQGVKSIVYIPIIVNNQPWGQIGFDNCGETRLFDEAEIAILRIAADSIAAAIERQAKDDELLRVEQERSQELERLNAELQQAIDRLSESEERYRTLFEISSEGIYRFEYHPPISLSLSIQEQAEFILQNGYIAEGNQTYVEMYGLDSPEKFKGFWLRDIHVQNSEQNRFFLRTLAANEHRIRNYESEEIDLKSNPRYFLNNITTIVKDGCAIGGWASQLDMTELRLAQQALLQAEQDRVAELAKTNQALKNSIDRLAADPDLNSFLGHVVLEIAQQLHLYSAWVELYQPSTTMLRLHLFVEQEQLRLEPNLPDMGCLNQGYLASDNLIWNWLLHTKQPLVVTLETLPQWFTGNELETQQQWAQDHGIQSGINILLMLGDEPLGLLVLFSTDRTTFGREEIELTQAFAQQATLAIALTRLAEESRQLAIIRDRNHLAREIHDTLAQGYAGILMQIQAANLLKQQPDQMKVHLDRACALAREGIADARRSVWLLQQDSDAYSDISSILTQLVEQMAIGIDIKPNIAIDGIPRSVKPDVGMQLLRITQESLNNALRHAQAETIQIRLHYTPKQLQITIDDDGGGFEPGNSTRGFGIRGMHQRAELIGAQLEIRSQLGQGTQVELAVSLI